MFAYSTASFFDELTKISSMEGFKRTVEKMPTSRLFRGARQVMITPYTSVERAGPHMEAYYTMFQEALRRYNSGMTRFDPLDFQGLPSRYKPSKAKFEALSKADPNFEKSRPIIDSYERSKRLP